MERTSLEGSGSIWFWNFSSEIARVSPEVEMVLLLVVAGCFSGMKDPELEFREEEEPEISMPTLPVTFGYFPVEMCLELAGAGPWPTRVVTLWGRTTGGTDAQYELHGGGESATRCEKTSLHLPRYQARVELTVRYMPDPLDRHAKVLRLRTVGQPEEVLKVESRDGRAFSFTVSTLSSYPSQFLVLTEQTPDD